MSRKSRNLHEVVTLGVLARSKATEDGCLVFGGYKYNGYGKVCLYGKPRNAHRLVYVDTHGEPPKGYQIDHICNNRGCVNIKHLQAITLKENTLKSKAVSAINAAKTHCMYGHKFDEENTLICKGKHGDQRKCRACFRRRYWAKQIIER